jgi:hypothetical protein
MGKVAVTLLAALCTVVVFAPATAGTVEQAVVMADPQMQVKAGAVQGCGFRLRLMPQSIAGLRSVVLLDASFNLYSEGLGLLKGGAMEVPIVGGKPGKPSNRPIESFWMKAQGADPTAPKGDKVLPAETKGYLLYGVPFESINALFEAVWSKAPITVGARLKGEPMDRIYVGSPEVSDADDQQGHECMARLISQMQKELEADKTAPGR